MTCQKFESFIQNIICLPSVSLLMLRRCSELMYSVIYKHLLDRLAGQITLTALSHIYPLLLVDLQFLVKHGEYPQSLLSRFTTDVKEKIKFNVTVG